jgi:hypothetical protein
MEDALKEILRTQTIKLDKIQEDQTEIKERLSAIDEHLAHINGRCSSRGKLMEKQSEEIVELKNWKSFVNGGLAVLTFISSSAVVLFLISHFA